MADLVGVVQCGTPFRIEFAWREDIQAEHDFSHPTHVTTAAGAGYGDGRTWTIDLGPPILQLTHQSLNDYSFRENAVKLLRYWIQIDRQTVARFHARVPLVNANYRWRVNEIPNARQELLAIDGRPGMNIAWLAEALVPSVVALGAHLQHQGNPAAFRLIPLLRWLEENRYGNLLTGGLLEKLARAECEGASPSKYL